MFSLVFAEDNTASNHLIKTFAHALGLHCVRGSLNLYQFNKTSVWKRVLQKLVYNINNNRAKTQP